MKRLSMICLAALLVMAASCKKDKEQGENAGKGFCAMAEGHAGNSKTHLVGNEYVQWNSGDAIMVSGETYTTPLCFTTTDANVNLAYFNSEEMPEDYLDQTTFTAYYPAASFSGNELTLGSEQTYVGDGFDNGANPMAALDHSTDLHFKNICGLFELQLYSPMECPIKTITITSNDETEMLWGKGTVTINDEGIPSLSTLTEGSNVLKLNCNGDAVLGKTANEALTFCFVVPVGTLANGFTVKVEDMYEGVWTKTASAKAEMAIERSMITRMPTTKVLMGTLSGLFSVSADKQVYFSQGNLQYIAQGGPAGNATATAEAGQSVGGTWRLADQQYDLIGRENRARALLDTPYTCTEKIDLFGWGTSGYNHGAVAYQPWCYGKNEDTYQNYYAYGSSAANLYDNDGKADWGFNPLYNGGFKENCGWRTLTNTSNGEWEYLTEHRTDADKLRGFGKVNGIKGVFILPDEWTLPTGCNFNPSAKNFTTNTYDTEKWAKMEAAGAVFLPDAGYLRWESSYSPVGGFCNGGEYLTIDNYDMLCYWSSSSCNEEDVYDFMIYGKSSPYIFGTHGNFRPHKFPVRLVFDAN